jgi:hypothetical protein
LSGSLKVGANNNNIFIKQNRQLEIKVIVKEDAQQEGKKGIAHTKYNLLKCV